MFEKIIEKLEKIKEGFTCTAFDSGINEAIDILKEEESKPFDPEDFGFIKLDKYTWVKALEWHPIFRWLIQTCGCINDKMRYKIEYQNLSDADIWKLEQLSVTEIEITSNFQAGIILKSLSII